MTDKPLWHPHPDDIPNTRLAQFQAELGRRRGRGYDSYAELHADTVADPVTFWRTVWETFDVIGEEGHDALENADQMPGAKWFPQAKLNFAENLLRHTDDHPAIKFRAETGQERSMTYGELHAEVAKLAHALREHGIQPGDRVAGFLPNLPETIVAMLAATSLGATWSSCSPDFGTAGVVDRLGQVEPRILFCVDSYAYGGKTHDCLARVEEIIKAIPSIEKVVVAPYLQPDPSTGQLDKAVTWQAFTDNKATTIEYERLPFDHPLYILYSSGTTGVPKCITHGAGGTLLQHLKELGLHTDITREDRLFYFTTCGWMMWNWMASGLALGCTLVLFEGSPFHPGPEALWDLADDFDVTVFGTGAKAISAWEKAGTKPRETHKLTNLKAILSTGSVLAPEGFDYVYRDIKEDVRLSSISGGTDIVSCFALGCPTLPVHRGELQCLGLGMDVKIRDEDGNVLANDEIGELCCDTPFPSMPVKFWNDPDNSKYKAAYFETFPGTWAHGDFAKITPHQGMIIYGRSDATLNPGGVRIGTAEIYRQVEKLPEVLESICVGQDWEDDVRVVLFVRLRDDLVLDDDLRDRIRKTIRANTTPRHVPAVIVQVADIPRTVSGKITELAVRDVIHGRKVKNLEALANPEALELFRELNELSS